MQRFVYTPRLEAYIKLKTGDIIDVSNEIISGSVSLRLNAMSTAELTLQNKHGRFVRRDNSGSMISPMDQIVIKMSRVGQPENVFAGYIDAAPHYQLYSGPVSISASCILKLLQHTYFDPSIMAMGNMFQKYGWFYDGTESLQAKIKAFDSLDSTGSIKDLISGMLVDVAGWPADMIQIQNLPEKLIEELSVLIKAEGEEWNKDYDRIIKYYKKFFAVDSSASATDVGGMGPGGSASPVSGNIPPEEIAAMLLDAGADADLATKLIAIAHRESSFTSDAINFNGGGDASSNDGSYDFGLYQFNTVHATGATNGGKGLSGPGSGASLTELKKAVKEQPQWVQDFYAQMSDPRLASAKAVRFGKEDSNLSAWIPGGKDSGNTWQTGIEPQWITDAANAVKAAQDGRQLPKDTQPIPGPDESEKGKGTSYKLDHITDGLGSGNWGAIDLFSPGGNTAGAAVYAVEAGKIIDHGHAVRRDGNPNGGSLTFQGTSGQKYWYGHIEDAAPIGTAAQPGQQIAVVSANHEAPHLHLGFENRAVGSTVTVYAPAIIGSGTAGGDPNVGGGGIIGTAAKTLSPGAVRDIAAQTFFSLQLGGFDQITANLLRGERALSNDISLMEWLSNIIVGAGRVFTSDAQGYFRAFYPDNFGIYGDAGGQTPMFFIAEIEVIDLTIQQNDTDLTTHVFATGPVSSGPEKGMSELDRALSTVASIEHPAFNWFLTVDEKANFDKIDFLKRYGARPYNLDLPHLLKPELLWMAAWMKFLELWSLRFTTNASFTFMPEIRPGWLINISNRIQMFVNGVTHTFNYTSGFTTSAELTSAASLTDDISWLPRAGYSSVIDSVPERDIVIDESQEPVQPEDIPEGSPLHPR